MPQPLNCSRANVYVFFFSLSLTIIYLFNPYLSRDNMICLDMTWKKKDGLMIIYFLEIFNWKGKILLTEAALWNEPIWGE